MTDLFLENTAAVLTKVLDGTAARQRVLAENIANVDTPGYTRKDLAFEDELRGVLEQPTLDPISRVAEIEGINLSVSEDTHTPRQGDGNNVEMEREMVGIAKNSLQYETAARLLSLHFRALQTAIHEGRR